MSLTADTPIEGNDLEGFLGVDPGPFADVSGEEEVTLGEFFPPAFFEESTAFESVEEFVVESPWEVDSFAEVPREELDEFVDEHTDFPSWEIMVRAAGDEFAHRASGY